MHSVTAQSRDQAGLHSAMCAAGSYTSFRSTSNDWSACRIVVSMNGSQPFDPGSSPGKRIFAFSCARFCIISVRGCLCCLSLARSDGNESLFRLKTGETSISPVSQVAIRPHFSIWASEPSAPRPAVRRHVQRRSGLVLMVGVNRSVSVQFLRSHLSVTAAAITSVNSV